VLPQTPAIIDKLGDEIAMALQRCAAVPESEMQRDEFNPVTLLARILQIYYSYQSRAEDNTGVGRDAALFTLFSRLYSAFATQKSMQVVFAASPSTF
jgi:hypothetical protein